MPTLDSTQQLIAVLLGLAALIPLVWKLFDALSKSWDRKNVLNMLADTSQQRDYWKAQTDECRAERDACKERCP